MGGNSKRKESLYTLIVNGDVEEMMRIKAMNANGEYQYQEVNAALRRLRATPLISAIYVVLLEIKKKTKGKTKISSGKEWQTNFNAIMLKFNLSEQNNGGDDGADPSTKHIYISRKSK
uniref:Uncharacterized protein n=1 Tax=Glossina pallidipes TaxID=7398 RepID=A0A1A9ZEL5_GLOPL